MCVGSTQASCRVASCVSVTHAAQVTDVVCATGGGRESDCGFELEPVTGFDATTIDVAS